MVEINTLVREKKFVRGLLFGTFNRSSLVEGRYNVYCGFKEEGSIKNSSLFFIGVFI